MKESRNYDKFLDRAKQAGVKVHCRAGFAIAFFFFTIFGTYAYAFYMGSIWIEKDYHNDLYNRPY